jgi:hypothetical protein
MSTQPARRKEPRAVEQRCMVRYHKICRRIARFTNGVGVYCFDHAERHGAYVPLTLEVRPARGR